MDMADILHGLLKIVNKFNTIDFSGRTAGCLFGRLLGRFAIQGQVATGFIVKYLVLVQLSG
jgi:hypothetical protein